MYKMNKLKDNKTKKSFQKNYNFLKLLITISLSKHLYKSRKVRRPSFSG